MSKDSKQDTEYDIFKDSALRYVGYSNEIGEAFRPIIPLRIVAYSYLIEFAYFISDTIHKGHIAYHDYKHQDNVLTHISKASAYTMVWQCFASVLLPAFTINRVVKLMGYISKNYMKNNILIKYSPTIIGLTVIPILPLVLDPIVDQAMNKITGKYYI
jgi:fission process protein 1